MSQYEIVYFPVRGKCETTRLMLVDNDIEFLDTFVSLEERWSPAPKYKTETPFGQLMIFKVDDKVFAQSGAINRFIARHVIKNLHGNNPSEEMEIDMYYEQANDIKLEIYPLCYTNWESGYKSFVDSIPSRLQPFEKKLQGNIYLINNRLTLADYCFYDCLFILNALNDSCLDQLPNCKAFFERFRLRPKLQAYYENPKYKDFKITGSGKL